MAGIDDPFPLSHKSVVSAAGFPAAPEGLPPKVESSVIDDKSDSSGLDVEDNLLHGSVRREDGTVFNVSWTREEQKKVVRKADFFLLPIFTFLFFFMHLDRSNISGVLTSTFMKDANLTQAEVNNGTSLLWLGVVLLEVPSNIILQRVGPHIWIPSQVVVWGVIEVLQYKVHNAGGWYAARLFLGLAESGFIPGSLWILSQWYTRDELAKRTVIFFWGTTLATSFGSLIAAGCIELSGQRGLHGWQWIFIIDGAGTVAAGLIGLAFLPKSAYRTKGFFRGKGWFSQREADVFVARIERDDPLKIHRSATHINFRDVIGVFADWRVWPHLLMCLTGLQAVSGLQIWGGTIVKSLGFSSVRANLLLAPGPLIGGIASLGVAFVLDRFNQRGPGIIFTGFWGLAGIISLYSLPLSVNNGQWSFYAALVFTQAAPNWQAFNVTWISLNARTPQRRAITYAVYIACSNLSGVYGGQVFRAADAPKYRTAFTACLGLGAAWLGISILQYIQYRVSNKIKNRKWKALTPDEQADYTEKEQRTDNKRLDFRYRL